MRNELVRPCYLVVDREHSGSISTRKLVIETAKLNVITAYSSAEAIETLRQFPAADGVVLDAGMSDLPCSALVRALKEIRPEIVVIAVGAPRETPCPEADHYVKSFNPTELLNLIEGLDPAFTQRVETRNDELQRPD